MKKTVDEKVKYNHERRTPFGYGYIWGVKAYRKYQANKEEQKRILAEIDDNSKNARNGKEHSRECSKGYMCGVRDAANEWKAKQKTK